MVDKPDPDDESVAHFSFTKKPIRGRRLLRISYRDVLVQISWPDGDDGIAQLDRFTSAFEHVMKAARAEMQVLDSLRDLDQEITDLLGGTE